MTPGLSYDEETKERENNEGERERERMLQARQPTCQAKTSTQTMYLLCYNLSPVPMKSTTEGMEIRKLAGERFELGVQGGVVEEGTLPDRARGAGRLLLGHRCFWSI